MTDVRTPPVDDGDLFCERVRQYAGERSLQRLHVLLAGCGQPPGPELLGLDEAGLELHVTGVDLDTPLVRERTQDRSDLAAWHLGDLRTVPMPPRAYDVVVAPYMIERLRHVELVLDRIVAALKPGGLLLVRFRDRDTAYGFVDRMTPGPLRTLLTSGGDPDSPPVYENLASYKGMQWYCGMRGLVIAEEHTSKTLSGQKGRGGSGRNGRILNATARLVAALSSGRLTASHDAVSLVIRKPENRFARLI